jgi:hypothetical protein
LVNRLGGQRLDIWSILTLKITFGAFKLRDKYPLLWVIGHHIGSTSSPLFSVN